jgi:hypothetical protein
MASQLGIVNEALGLLGEMPIDDIDDTQDPKAVKVKAFWDVARDQLLERFAWSFATTRVALQQDAEAPTYGFTYAYVIPADCIRVLEATAYTDDMDVDDRSKMSCRIESGRVLTNETAVYLKYVRRVEETGRFSPLFCSALAAALAAMLASALTKSGSTTQAMLQLAEMRLREARASDNIQSGAVMRKTSSWKDAR